MASLSVIIVNYNVAQFLELCLQSVFASFVRDDLEVWVVDNNSSDDSLTMLQEKFPEVKLIANKVNTGFARANNQAIRESNSDYVLLLNPDTIVPEDCFGKCLNFMNQHPEAGALGVRMIDGSGSFLPESKRGLPGPWVSFCKAFGLSRLFPDSPHFGGYYLSYLNEQQTHDVDVLSGAFMFMRKEALQTAGLLDESFFMYGEDVDLSYRIQQAGYRNYYFPEAPIIHFKGESTKRGSISFVRNFYKAMILFSEKHFSRNRWFSLFIYLGIGIRAGLAIMKRFFDFSAAFVLEFGIAFLGMAFIKNWWELNFKGIPGMYPDFFIQLLVPVYILVWLTSTRLTASYSRDYGPGEILKGIILGTVLISAVTNFFDDYRFSKGLILIGAAWTWAVCTARLIMNRLLQSKKVLFQLKRKKRLLVYGDEKSYLHAAALLEGFQQDVLICGRCGPAPAGLQPEFLGNENSIPELSFRLGLDELLFCQESISNASIVSTVEKYRNLNIRFSIMARQGRHLVSSSHKHSRGSILQTESIPELLLPHNLRLKRLTDLVICLLLAPAIPVLLLRVQSPVRFIRNLLWVLAGKLTWIGTRQTNWQRFGLRPSVLSSSTLAGTSASAALIDSLDKLYLQEFLPEHEIWTVLKNIRHLGTKTD